MKRTIPPVHLGNESSMIRALADHYKAHYCATYGGEFNREAFLHWLDVSVPYYPDEQAKQGREAAA